MTEFLLGIAGVTVQVNAIHETTKVFCKDYLTEGTPDFSVEILPEDITREMEHSAREDALEGIPTRHFSDAYLEPLALYRKIVDKIVAFDTLLFHGSVVAMDGTAYLFTAKSGTGKSTHTRLWRQEFGDRVVMVNDDKPLLRISNSGVLVCGTPWDGKHRLNTNCMVPLKAICILERGEQNHIQQISANEALPMLLQQSQRPVNMAKYLELLDRLTKHLSFYRLQCNMAPEAAYVAYEGMQ